ncbi:signal recognition particle-docking protein FtsY [Candidatus Berkiella cookevillensis]|uniref:Signal recognition particle receptor FtsY n=2 Tax=Candidatus Berkiella cookevillensis TaxID=437022 RepID=A0A0Q9YEC3_9GAMM
MLKFFRKMVKAPETPAPEAQASIPNDSNDSVESLETISTDTHVEEHIATQTGLAVEKTEETEDTTTIPEVPSSDKAADTNEHIATEAFAQPPITTEESLVEVPTAAPIERQAEMPVEAPVETPTKISLFQKLKQSLTKTRTTLTEGLANLFLGKKTIDAELLEDLETLLLVADVGVDATQKIIDSLTQQISRKTLKDPQAVYQALQQALLDILKPCEKPLNLQPSQKPFVLLMVGVNGAGKTTTIGKLAQKFKQNKQSVMLAAGDTFRAAAIEQLQVWGERNQVPVIAQHTGADSASVIYDAVQSATAKNVDVLIADTAGRLHTRENLMEELKKILRVTQKIIPNAPHEVMLVLDASTGQNALQQARVFHSLLNLTGIVITKLDGTAKGGIIFAIANELKLPIRFIGVGESIDDLRPFEAQAFVDALFENTSNITTSTKI